MTAPSAEATERLGQRIAGALESEIIAAGWPVGRLLGNEEQLVRRFGVSRWAVREAVAITQRDGLTEMRRGRSGGLVVSASPEEVAITTLRNYLLFMPIDTVELLRIATMIDGIASVFAARRSTEAQIGAVRAALAAPRAADPYGRLRQMRMLHELMLDLTNNPAVRIFGTTLSHLSTALWLYLGLPELAEAMSLPMVTRHAELRRAQLECTIAADSTGAIQAAGAAGALLVQVFTEDAPLHPKTSTRELVHNMSLAVGGGRPIKLVDVLTMQIQLDVARAGLGPGDPIAPEKQLMARYGVGRGPLREAIRNLERHGFVRAAEGRCGGLCVAKPKPEIVIASVVRYLRYLRTPVADVARLAAEFAGFAVEYAARQAAGNKTGIDPLLRSLAALRADPAAPGLALAFYQALSEAGGNAIIRVFLGIVAEIAMPECPRGDDSGPRLVEQLDALAEALRRGDSPLSRRYMMHVNDMLVPPG